MAWIAVGGLAVSIGSQIFGAVKKAKAAKANKKLLDSQIAESKADENRNYLDTNEAKSVIKQAEQNQVEQAKNIEGRAAITGASDEAKVAGRTGVLKNYNDTLSKLSGYGTQYSQSAKNRTRSFVGAQMDINNQKAEGAAALMDNASALAGTAAMKFGGKGISMKADKAQNAPPGEVLTEADKLAGWKKF
jgi:ABC-type Na+ efflux pump permease subunit